MRLLMLLLESGVAESLISLLIVVVGLKVEATISNINMLFSWILLDLAPSVTTSVLTKFPHIMTKPQEM